MRSTDHPRRVVGDEVLGEVVGYPLEAPLVPDLFVDRLSQATMLLAESRRRMLLVLRHVVLHVRSSEPEDRARRPVASSVFRGSNQRWEIAAGGTHSAGGSDSSKRGSR
jgi:hypothetical protein